MPTDSKDLEIYARCEPVPFTVHESDMARLVRAHESDMERMVQAHAHYVEANKRQFIVILVLIFSLVISWVGFLAYESMFEAVTETTVQDVWQHSDGGGVNRFTGGDYNGNDAEGSDSYDSDLSEKTD